MAFWLFKSEPNTWSWQDQVNRGEKGEHWDGVRNYLARNNMREMKTGDLGFFYHSVKEKKIVGIVEVIKEAYPDHTDPKQIFDMVDIKALVAFEKSVTLQEIKETPELSEMALVKSSRLSVQPVAAEEWAIVCKMGAMDNWARGKVS